MKNHSKNEFWSYKHIGNHVSILYYIDGEFRSEHSSAQYLMDNYKMSISDAYKYVNEIRDYR